MATDVERLESLIDEIDAVGLGDTDSYANEHGDPTKVFRVDYPTEPTHAVPNSGLDALITDVYNNPTTDTAGTLPVADGVNSNEAVNLGQLLNALTLKTPVNGDSNVRFKAADAIDQDDLVTLGQVNFVLDSAYEFSIGDVIESTNNDLLEGFQVWGSSNTPNVPIADYTLLVDSLAVVVTDVDESAGTFTFLGHGGASSMTLKIKVR